MSKYDNHGQLPSGLTEITNTTGRPERVYTREEIQQTWDNLKMAMVPVMKDLVKVWDELRHNRPLMNALGIYRLPGDKPLLQNGRKPR